MFYSIVSVFFAFATRIPICLRIPLPKTVISYQSFYFVFLFCEFSRFWETHSQCKTQTCKQKSTPTRFGRAREARAAAPMYFCTFSITYLRFTHILKRLRTIWIKQKRHDSNALRHFKTQRESMWNVGRKRPWRAPGGLVQALGI